MHQRRSLRLQGYDYTRHGAYFVTICAHARLCVFGQVVNGEIVMNAWGRVVIEEWQQTAVLRPNAALDAFVVMPNHIHGIIVIVDDGDFVGAQCIAPLHPQRGITSNNVPANALGAIVRGFKSAVTRTINRLPNPPDHPIWQRNYYEHIIRNQEDLARIQTYIDHNPANWAHDSLYST